MAKEAAEAKRQAFYLLGVEKTQARLAEELAEVYKDYCNATWNKSFNVARVPIASTWRQPGSVFYHPHICEVPDAISLPLALAQETLE